MESKKFHRRLILSIASVFLAFAILTVGIVLVPTSYAKWQQPDGGKIATGTITATQYYKVTFNSMGGTAVPYQMVEAGTKPTQPTPTKDGRVLMGWYNDEGFTDSYGFGLIDRNTNYEGYLTQVKNDKNIIKADRTLYAGWGFVVKVETNGAWLGSVPSNGISVLENRTIGEPQIGNRADVGYTLGGWYTDEALNNEYDFSSPVTSNFTIYACWGNEVQFHYNDGTDKFDAVFVKSDKSSGTETRGKLEKPQDPTRDGYTFAGWYTDKDCTEGKQYAFGGNVLGGGYDGLVADSDLKFHLYAKWTEETTTPPEELPSTSTITNGILKNGDLGTEVGVAGNTVFNVTIDFNAGDTFAVYWNKQLQKTFAQAFAGTNASKVELNSSTGVITVKEKTTLQIRAVWQGTAVHLVIN